MSHVVLSPGPRGPVLDRPPALLWWRFRGVGADPLQVRPRGGFIYLSPAGWLGDSLKVKVKAPPEKGRANEAVIALLAEPSGSTPRDRRLEHQHGERSRVAREGRGGRRHGRGRDQAGVFFRKQRKCREKRRFRKAGISAPPVRETPLFLLYRSGAPSAPTRHLAAPSDS